MLFVVTLEFFYLFCKELSKQSLKEKYIDWHEAPKFGKERGKNEAY